MAEKKMTKKEVFAEIMALIENTEYERKAEVINFLKHEIELLDKKSSKATMTKTQKENVGVCELIKEALFEIAKPVTITELMGSNAELRHYTPQKISALIKQMKDKGEIVRTEEKKKAYFSLANTDND